MNTKLTLKQLVAASILAISLPLATAAVAHEGGSDGRTEKGAHCEKGARMHHGAGKPGLPHYLRGIQLSETQEDQVFNLMHAQVPVMRDQHKQSIKLMQELRATSQADQFDDAKAQQIANQLANLDKEKTLTRARNDAKIFALLTPEQRQKAREAKMQKQWGRGEHTRFKSHRGFKSHHDVMKHHSM